MIFWTSAPAISLWRTGQRYLHACIIRLHPLRPVSFLHSFLNGFECSTILPYPPFFSLSSWHCKVLMMDDEDGEMHLRHLKLYEAASEEDALNLLFMGNWNRITSETPM